MSVRESLQHPAILAGLLVNAFVLALGMFAIRTGPEAFIALAREDGLVEWLQFLCFASLALLLAFVALDRLGRQRRASLEVLTLTGLTGLVALAALEEISWFQRVLDVPTPEFFQQHNRQLETNLHNLFIGDLNLHKEIIVRVIFVTGITHNLILPIVAIFRPAVRRTVESVGLYLPPLAAALGYLTMLALSQVLIDHPRRGELGETFGAVHYLSTAFAAYFAGVGYARPLFVQPEDRTRASWILAWFIVFLVFVAWLLAAGYRPAAT
jgi:hypothetical protein